MNKTSIIQIEKFVFHIIFMWIAILLLAVWFAFVLPFVATELISETYTPEFAMVPSAHAATITRVQSNAGGCNGCSATITMSMAGVTPGNLLVATITSGRTVTMQAGSGWTEAVSADVGNNKIVYKIAGAGEPSPPWTYTMSGPDQTSWVVAEYSSSTGWPAVPATFDVGASTSSAGEWGPYVSTKGSGSTVNTSSIDALAFAGWRLRDSRDNGGAVTGRTWNNGFNYVNSSIAQPGGQSSVEAISADKILSTTGVQQTQFSWAQGRTGVAGTIAIFKPNGSGGPPPPSGTVSGSALTSACSATASVYNTASITPTANSLVLLAVSGSRLSVRPPQPTVTGNGLTWVLVNSAFYDTTGGHRGETFLYRAMGSSPSSGPVSINFGTSITTACWQISQFSGVNTSGNNGSGAIVQDATSTILGTSLTVPLGAFSSPNNATYGAFGKDINNTTTPGTGFSELGDAFTTLDDTNAIQTEWKNSNDTSVDASWGSFDLAGAVAVEIGAGSGAPPAISVSRVQPPATAVASAGNDASATFTSQPVAGNLLVAISAHRMDGATPAISGTGWSLAFNDCYAITSGTCGAVSNQNRRALAVWWKIAGTGEPTNIRTNWTPGSNSGLIIQEFEIGGGGSFTHDAQKSNNSATSSVFFLSTGSTVPLPPADYLLVTAMMSRGLTGGASWNNGVGSNFLFDASASGSAIGMNTGFGIDSINSTKGSTGSWGTSQKATAGIVVFALSATAPPPPPPGDVPPEVVTVFHAPEPVIAGMTVDFTVTWKDVNPGNTVRASICKTNSMLTPNVCDGGAWAQSSALTSENPIGLSYTTTLLDAGLKGYYVFVCDDGDLCSTVQVLGAFNVITTPIIQPPVIDTGPIVEGGSIIFTVPWADSDDITTGLYICKTDSISVLTGCDAGQEWVSKANTSQNPATVTLNTAMGDAGTYYYYAFVCDLDGCSTTSEASPDTHRQFVVSLYGTPIITADVLDSGPVLAGDGIQFTVTWSDKDDTTTNLYVCKTDSVNPATGCDSGQTWTSINNTGTSTVNLTYQTVAGDAGTPDYYVFACDATECSATSEVLFDTHKQFGVIAQTLTVGTFYATPTAGAAPLDSYLTALIGGTAVGTINYSFWWNCTNDSTSVQVTIDGSNGQQACGDPKNDPTIGDKYEYVTSTAQTTINHEYSTSGTYTAKVIVERGGIASSAQEQTTVAVSAVPVINNVDPTPNPAAVGQQVTFSVDWFDPDSSSVRINICRSNRMSTPYTCDDGAWTELGTFTSVNPADLFYTPTASDGGVQNFWAFVCDDIGSCTPTPWADTFTVQRRPVVLPEPFDTSPVLELSPLKFTIPWADADDTTTSLYICKTDSVNLSTGCDSGQEWASNINTSVNPAEVIITVPVAGTYDYYVFVCDVYGCSTTSSASPDTDRQFVIVKQIVYIDIFTANPSAGGAPLSSYLKAEVSGNTADTINYSFWWNCTNDSTSVQVTIDGSNGQQACGDPKNDPTIGDKYDFVTSTAQTTLNHEYSTSGTYTAKVIVERGAAPAKTDQAIVSVYSTPIIQNVIDGPDPVAVGQEMKFTVDWFDYDINEQVRVSICKTNSMIAPNVCDGGYWQMLGVYTGVDPIDLWYTPIGADAGPQNYWAFVCDDEGGCSSGYPGIFDVRYTPIVMSDPYYNSPVLSGETLTFNVPWADADDSTINLYVCKTDGIALSGCDGGAGDTWASSLGDSANPAIAMTTAPAPETYEYYVFVCDASACSDTSEALPDTHKQFIVDSEIINIDEFFATPFVGAAPLDSYLTVAISGTAANTSNYSFWWDCDDPTPYPWVASDSAVCGVLDAPVSPGVCRETPGVGYKCDGMTTTVQTTNIHTYSTGGSYTPKVIVERGSASAVEERIAVIVSDAPIIQAISDTPDPVVVGQQIAFTVDWFDPSAGTQVRVSICKTNSMTVPNICDGGAWTSLGTLTTADPIDLFYTTTGFDVETQGQGYWVFVCDSADICTTTPPMGTFTVQYAPEITADVSDTGIVMEGDPITFTADWLDLDDVTTNLYVCKTDGISPSGCAGGPADTWASSLNEPFPTATATYTAMIGYGGTYEYYVFVCDATACSSTSEASPDTHKQFTVDVKTLIIDTFVAVPASGAEPFDSYLTASISGTATGDVSYSFWWDCEDTTTSVSDAVVSCGDPNNVAFGEKHNYMIPTSQTTNVHTYATGGTYRAKVIVERFARATQKQIDVIVSAVPVITSVTTTPNTVVANSMIEFTVDWTDDDSSLVRINVCRTNQMSVPYVCDGGSWTELGSYTTSHSVNLYYTPPSSEAGIQSYWVFACDNTAACTPIPTQGTFSVRQTPVVTPEPLDTSPVFEALPLKFTVPWNDNDDSTTNLYICKTDGITLSGCDGGALDTWASLLGTSDNPAEVTITAPPDGTYDYYIFVCDAYGCSSTSESSPDTHRQFVVEPQVINIVKFIADPSTGAVPLDSSLNVAISGTAANTSNYSFWWDCDDSTPYPWVASDSAVCGVLDAPVNSGECRETPGVGYKCDGMTATTQTTSIHTYATEGAYTAKVIVERGAAPPVQSQTDVNVLDNSVPVVEGITNTGPVEETEAITFNVTWSDFEGITPEPGWLRICKTSAPPTGWSPQPNCPGGSWDNGAVPVSWSGTVSTTPYSTVAGDNGIHTAWAFVCQAENECSLAGGTTNTTFIVSELSATADLLDINISTADTSYDLGDTIIFDLDILNNGYGGTTDASGVVVEVTLPVYVSYDSGGSGCSPLASGQRGVTLICDNSGFGGYAIPESDKKRETLITTAVTANTNVVATATLKEVDQDDSSPEPGYGGNNSDMAVVRIVDPDAPPNAIPTLSSQEIEYGTFIAGPEINWDENYSGPPFNADNINVSVDGEISLTDPLAGPGVITSRPLDTRAQNGVAVNSIRWDGERPGTTSDPRYVVYDWMYSMGSNMVTVNCGQLPGGNSPGPSGTPGEGDPVCDSDGSGEWFMDVSVTTGRYSGWLWSDAVGWIALSCDTAGVDNCNDPVFSASSWGAPGFTTQGWGVWETPSWDTDVVTSLEYRRVRGWAWSPIAGWIAMGCDSVGLSICGGSWNSGPTTIGYDSITPSSSVAAYRGNADSVWVSNDTASGRMRYHGWAWSSQVGWISFDCNQVNGSASGIAALYDCDDDLLSPAEEALEAGYAYNPYRIATGGSAEVRFWVAGSDCPNGETGADCSGPSDWQFVDATCSADNAMAGVPYNLYPISQVPPPGGATVGDLTQCLDEYWNKRYFRYRVQLCPFNGCMIPGIWRPVVRDVFINFSP